MLVRPGFELEPTTSRTVVRCSTNRSAVRHFTGFLCCLRHSHQPFRSHQKRDAKITKIFFCSGIINLLIDGFTYNTRGHLAHCSYFSSPLRENTTQLAKYPRVLCVKPSIKIYIYIGILTCTFPGQKLYDEILTLVFSCWSHVPINRK